MSNRDGILDSHPSERVKMPPELAAFDRWDADPNDLAKWEAAMAALAPAAGPGRRSRQFQRHRQSLSQQVEARVPSVVRPSPVSTTNTLDLPPYERKSRNSTIARTVYTPA